MHWAVAKAPLPVFSSRKAPVKSRSTSVISLHNFPSSILQYIVRQPLATLDVVEKYDIKINLKGGGFKGQSEAARLAIARALVKINEEDKPALRAEGFLTRDSRVVERKKPGRPKARKRFQFSKR